MLVRSVPIISHIRQSLTASHAFRRLTWTVQAKSFMKVDSGTAMRTIYCHNCNVEEEFGSLLDLETYKRIRSARSNLVP